jgi:hypothetical protein
MFERHDADAGVCFYSIEAVAHEATKKLLFVQ